MEHTEYTEKEKRVRDGVRNSRAASRQEAGNLSLTLHLALAPGLEAWLQMAGVELFLPGWRMLNGPGAGPAPIAPMRGELLGAPRAISLGGPRRSSRSGVGGTLGPAPTTRLGGRFDELGLDVVLLLKTLPRLEVFVRRQVFLSHRASPACFRAAGNRKRNRGRRPEEVVARSE